jgi:hypothetical protein
MRITPAIVTSGGSHSLAGPLRMGYMKVEKKHRRVCLGPEPALTIVWIGQWIGQAGSPPVRRRAITLQSDHESDQKDDHEDAC